jgi:hypothetical protein
MNTVKRVLSVTRRTHYGFGKNEKPFEYFTVRPETVAGETRFVVHGFGVYEQHSVLAGQSRKVRLHSYATKAEALEVYPEAENGNDFSDPQVSVAHLPGENDFVPGGAYPDDIDDGY